MIVRKIDEFTGGWLIGDFNPSVFKTKDFEVCYKKHAKDEAWPRHYHKWSTEYNVLLKGRMSIVVETPGAGANYILRKGDVFIIQPGEVANPHFITDCELLIVKIPSWPGDKYFDCDEWLSRKPDLSGVPG